jgi:hypothetical protein
MTETKTQQVQKYPFFTRTMISLGFLDRLRVLFYGKLFVEIRSELENEPGTFVNTTGDTYVPGLWASKPKSAKVK